MSGVGNLSHQNKLSELVEHWTNPIKKT